MTLRLAMLGFLSLCGQVVLLREVNVLFFGSEVSYVVGVGVWLAATAAGTLLDRRSATSLSPLPLGVAIVVGVFWARAAPWLDGDLRGAVADLPRQVAVAFVVLVPAALLSGRLLRRLATAATVAGRHLTSIYAFESAGAAAGAAAATWSPAWGMSNLVLASTCLCVALTGCRRRRVGLVLATAIVAGLFVSSPLDEATIGWRHPGLTMSRDTPAGRMSLSRRDGQVNVYADGALVAESASAAAEQFAWPALLQRDGPRRVAVLGYAFDGLVAEVVAVGTGRLEMVDWIVPDRRVVEEVGGLVSAEFASVLARPEVRVVEADPRAWLRQAGDYDCLLVAASGSNRFLTAEFFASCAEHLSPGGVLALRLPAAPNVWTPARRRRLTSIGGALDRSFADVRALPGDDLVLLASVRELPRTADALVARLAAVIEGGKRPRLVSEPWLRYLYSGDRRTEVEALLGAADTAVNVDGRPVGAAWTRVIWLTKWWPGRADWDPVLDGWSPREPGWPAALLFATSVGAVWWCRRRARRRSVALAAVAGFCGTVLEAVLLLDYENLHGSLYGEIGLLLTGFMAGLVGGAAVLDRLPQPRRRVGVLLLLYGVGLLLIAAWLTSTGAATGLVAAVLAQAAVGFLVAGLFCYAAARDGDSGADRIASLFAADLAGGCAGSLAAVLWLIPLAGLTQTALLLLPVLVLAALLV